MHAPLYHHQLQSSPQPSWEEEEDDDGQYAAARSRLPSPTSPADGGSGDNPAFLRASTAAFLTARHSLHDDDNEPGGVPSGTSRTTRLLQHFTASASSLAAAAFPFRGGEAQSGCLANARATLRELGVGLYRGSRERAARRGSRVRVGSGDGASVAADCCPATEGAASDGEEGGSDSTVGGACVRCLGVLSRFLSPWGVDFLFLHENDGLTRLPFLPPCPFFRPPAPRAAVSISPPLSVSHDLHCIFNFELAR